jgi:signal transduction histidine kinase
LSLRLKLYLTLVAALGTTLLVMAAPHDVNVRWAHYAGWILICIVSESLYVTTLSGSGTVTMASTAGLAAAILWGQGAGMWIAAISTLAAELFVIRKPLVRAQFNTFQIALTTWLATGAFALLGGPADGVVSLASRVPGQSLAVRLAVPILGLFVGYLLSNRLLLAVAVAWSTERPYRRVLREDWFYVERLLNDSASLLLSPLMVLSFLSIGYPGVVLFVAPLWIINESSKRYLELKRAQQQIIHTERMAAKGEMAAEVGHELRNQLAAISGRAQMLMRDQEKQAFANVGRHAQIILEQAQRMERLSKGLMDFSNAELKIERVDLNQLIQRSIEFVRTQNRFDGVDWEVSLCEPAPELRADPGQLQQVLLNLFLNSADAMKERVNGSGRKAITVTSERDEGAQQIRVVVRDTGPGIPKSNLTRVFEPHFTTKVDGHGFGLSTSYRIIVNHGGRIVAESAPGQGATFVVTLPSSGSAGWK